MLDYKYVDFLKLFNDYNMYILGFIGNYNIVIVCLFKGEIGINLVVIVVILMVNVFLFIKIGLMVGFGGGILFKVWFGDVVISLLVGQYFGVVQWDLGKVKEGGKFEWIGLLNNLFVLFCIVLMKLEIEYEMSGFKIFQYLEDLKCKWLRLVLKYVSCDYFEDFFGVLDDLFCS